MRWSKCPFTYCTSRVALTTAYFDMSHASHVCSLYCGVSPVLYLRCPQIVFPCSLCSIWSTSCTVLRWPHVIFWISLLYLRCPLLYLRHLCHIWDVPCCIWDISAVFELFPVVFETSALYLRCTILYLKCVHCIWDAPRCIWDSLHWILDDPSCIWDISTVSEIPLLYLRCPLLYLRHTLLYLWYPLLYLKQPLWHLSHPLFYLRHPLLYLRCPLL